MESQMSPFDNLNKNVYVYPPPPLKVNSAKKIFKTFKVCAPEGVNKSIKNYFYIQKMSDKCNRCNWFCDKYLIDRCVFNSLIFKANHLLYINANLNLPDVCICAQSSCVRETSKKSKQKQNKKLIR